MRKYECYKKSRIRMTMTMVMMIIFMIIFIRMMLVMIMAMERMVTVVVGYKDYDGGICGEVAYHSPLPALIQVGAPAKEGFSPHSPVVLPSLTCELGVVCKYIMQWKCVWSKTHGRAPHESDDCKI